MKIRRERRRRHDYRSLPSSGAAAKAFVDDDDVDERATRGVVDEGQKSPDSGGIREWQARWKLGHGGESGESMTYAEAGSARDSAQFPASLANDQKGPEGG